MNANETMDGDACINIIDRIIHDNVVEEPKRKLNGSALLAEITLEVAAILVHDTVGSHASTLVTCLF